MGASYPGGTVVTNNVILGSLVLPRGSCISVCPCNSAPEPPHIRTANARVRLQFTTGRIIIVDLLNWRLSISAHPYGCLCAVKRRVAGRNCDHANQNSGTRMSGFSCVPFKGPLRHRP